jgi:hypothetical protein
MKVKVEYTVDVDDTYRKALNHSLGRTGKASRDELKGYFKEHGTADYGVLPHYLRDMKEKEANDKEGRIDDACLSLVDTIKKGEPWWPGDRIRCLKDIRDKDGLLVMGFGETGLITCVDIDGDDRVLTVGLDPNTKNRVQIVWPCMIEKNGKATRYELQNSHDWECYKREESDASS